tara:strand:- start:257 stop:361 length:105 start_codon:yes stop_codon:yes gene_type:complete
VKEQIERRTVEEKEKRERVCAHLFSFAETEEEEI